MPFEHACFISYRRGQFELTRRFIEELIRALKNHIEPYMNEGVYFDETGLQGGDFFDEGLADALCKSVCMILVFTPKYFDQKHTFCAREYLAMERLEEKRLKLGEQQIDRKRGLIIPIIFRGSDHLPAEIKTQRHFYDFSGYTLVEPEITNNERYVNTIEQIAQRIYELYKSFSALPDDPCSDCNGFSLPTAIEIQQWLANVTITRPGFPGREEH